MREQNESRGLQRIGSWNPHVPFRYLGWKKPVNPVSFPWMKLVWSSLNKFCQFEALERYFIESFFPSPLAIVATQKSLYEYSKVLEILLEFVPKPR